MTLTSPAARTPLAPIKGRISERKKKMIPKTIEEKQKMFQQMLEEKVRGEFNG